MAKEVSQNVELTIEYPDYDDYDMTEVVVETVINVDDDEWTIDAHGLEEPQTFRVVEEREQILVAPVDKHGPSTTQTADYEPESGRVEPQYLKHDGKYVEAIVGDAVDETLGEMVRDARKQFVAERGIQDASEFDVPEISLEVKEGQPLFPSSQRGRTMAPRDRLVVEPQSDSVAFERWQDAIVSVANRYEVYAGTANKGTDELLAPDGYEADDRLTLAEYLDAFYTLDPSEVVETVVPQVEIDEAKEREAKRDAMESEYPELRNANISNLDAFDDAVQAGERVEVGDRTSSCNDAGKECNLDLITLYATPERDIETERVHTY